MLKIKDNVDLKELLYKLKDEYNYKEVIEQEKYYLLIIESDIFMTTDWKGKKYKMTDDFCWQVWKDDRRIRYMGYSKPTVQFCSYSMLEEFDFIYDLIKDGLVEKVEE